MQLSKEDEDKIRSRLYKLGYLGEEITLDNNINYIVSGLERSGTSLMMQILQAAQVPLAYDMSRPADSNNPKGYFELYSGTIINKLILGEENLETLKGKVVKITSYGLKFLPKNRTYKIIYMKRNLDEIINSMQTMMKVNNENKKSTRELLKKLEDFTEDLMEEDNNIYPYYINYNTLMKDPTPELNKLCIFLGIPESKIKKMVLAIDKDLYKERIEV